MFSMISVPLILDILLICLLLATIGFCLRLNRKLSIVREAQGDLQKVAAEFDRAIVRSKLGIEELKTASKKTGQELQKEVDVAQSLLEEMKLINASSSRIADRIQEGASAQNTAGTDSSAHVSSITPTIEDKIDPTDLRPRTEAEKELLDMLTKSK